MKSNHYKSYYILSLILLIIIFSLWATITTKEISCFNSKIITSNFPTIILDAGHGGIDGGSVGITGAIEKDINLDITLKVKDILKNYNLNIIMTRENDYSIHDSDATTIRKIKNTDLHNRLKIIQSNPKSIFISVHQNFYTNSKYNGAQIFYSPNNPDSEVFAKIMQEQFKNTLQNNNNREVKQSGSEIFLLYNATVPAIMAECGFLSNYNEENLLQTEQYRTRVATVIATSIIKFCEQYTSNE